MTITWKYAAGDESVKGFKEGLREGRRQGRQGADPAVPERRVPGAADRDRGAEARCGLRLLRRRRRGQVRQGLRGGRPQQDDPALRPGLPDRRHARGAGRRRAGHADDAALRRRPRHAARQRFRTAYAKAYKAAARRLRGAGLRRGADARPSASTAVKGDVTQEGRVRRRRCEKAKIDSPRGTFTIGRRTTRCRTSTCARSRARRTRCVEHRASRRWPTRRAAARCEAVPRGGRMDSRAPFSSSA